MISKFNAALESAEAKSHKYKMRWLRVKHASDKRTNHCEQYDNGTQKVSHLNANTLSKSTRRSKTCYQLRHVTVPHVKRSLLWSAVVEGNSETAKLIMCLVSHNNRTHCLSMSCDLRRFLPRSTELSATTNDCEGHAAFLHCH